MNIHPIISVSISFLLYVLMPSSYGQQSNDFRNVRWGFRPKQVKEAETARPALTKRDWITYARVPLANRTVGLEYNFNGDSLLSASYYYYTTASITKDSVLTAATNFEALLNEKYGRSKTSLLGEVRNVVWLTPRTQISLSVGNVNKGWSLEVQYLCRVCSPEQAKAGAAGKEVFKPLKDIKDF